MFNSLNTCRLFLLLLCLLHPANGAWDTRYIETFNPSLNLTRVEKFSRGVTYNTFFYAKDKYGRRQTSINKNADQYAIFLGCSITFGDGVDDPYTLPQYFQYSMPRFQAYNYGVSGFGPNNVYRIMTTRNLRQEIPYNSGACFYIYPVGWHEIRTRMHLQNLYWCDNYPYYKTAKNGRLIYCGKLKDAQRLLYWFLVLADKFYGCFGHPNIDFPRACTDREYKLVADLLLGIKNEYVRQFKNDNFYVVIHPQTSRDKKTILHYLDERKINYIDLHNKNFTPSAADGYAIAANDGHPTAKLNKYTAGLLAGRFKELIKLKPLK